MDLRGEGGNDRLEFLTSARVSGGSGSDSFVFKAVVPVTINDLTPDDSIDLSALLDVSVSDAFDSGYLKSSFVKGYTHVAIDADGGGDNFVDLVILKGIFAHVEDFIV